MRGISKRHFSCVWPLLQNLIGICFSGGVISPNSRPKFNDWVLPETLERYSDQEINDYFDALHHLLLEYLENNPARLVELFENQDIYILASDLLQIMETNIEDFRGMEFQLRHRMQNALRKYIATQAIIQEPKDSNDEITTKAKKFIELLDSDDQVENFVWLFTGSYLDLPEPREWDWKKREKQIASLRENALSELLKLDKPLHHIGRLSDLSEDPRLIGFVLGRIPNASKYQREILESFLPKADHPGEFALGFIVSTYYSNGFDWLKLVAQNLLSETRSEEAIKVLTTVGSTPEIRDFVREQSEGVSDLYWQSVPHIDSIRDNDDFSVSIANLLAAKRWDLAIMLANSCLRLERSVGSAHDYFKVLEHGKVASADETKKALQKSGNWRIAQIFKHLDSFADLDTDWLARLEVFYIELLNHSERPPKYITRQIEQSPEFFTELLCLSFGTRNESWNDFSDEEMETIRGLANIASKIRSAWKGYPGIEAENEDQRDQTIRNWCQKVLELTEKADRKTIGQEMIGEVLSRVPAPKKDGIWPGLVAREYIEDDHDEIATGLALARYNSRGITCRSPDAGGQQEREIAKKYREDAEKLQYEWFKTSSLLIHIAEKYERNATWNDAEAERYIDP